jgi:3-oxoacyl-[acyl-carrier-protein] synthase II
MDAFISYGIVSAKRALEDAGLDAEKQAALNPERCGVVIGSGMGGIEIFHRQASVYNEKGVKRLSPFFIPYTITNMASGMVAIDVGFRGPNYSISTACATGNHSIMAAASELRAGRADLMLCGGSEGAVSELGLAGFCAIKALSTRNESPQEASRPWDKGRDGFVMGEGAGVLVLETLEHAQKRGARILCEYAGGGANCDAYHMTDPRPDGSGVAACIRMALDDAGMQAEEINLVNGHATSTPVGDMAEIRGVLSALPDPSKVTMNATKSMLGHTLGAAGGLEAAACVLAIHKGEVHPTLNLSDPEEEVQAFHLPRERHAMEVTGAISNSFGFGGHNSSLVFRPYVEV